VLQKVPAGFDEFRTEKYQDQVAAVLKEWSAQLLRSPQSIVALEKVIPVNFSAASVKASRWKPVRTEAALNVSQGEFAVAPVLARNDFLADLRSLLGSYSTIITAEFQVISIRSAASSSAPDASRLLETVVRFEFVGTAAGFHREQRVGNWKMSWELLASGELRLQQWKVLDEVRSRALAPVFLMSRSLRSGATPPMLPN
jgi:hypothetical protein